jgi:hypothetical protein
MGTVNLKPKRSELIKNAVRQGFLLEVGQSADNECWEWLVVRRLTWKHVP